MMDFTLIMPSGYEWIILVVLILILLFGARKIPELARSIGRARGEFERGRLEYEEELRRAREEKESNEHERLRDAARALGIDVEGKSYDELREEVKRALDKDSETKP